MNALKHLETKMIVYDTYSIVYNIMKPLTEANHGATYYIEFNETIIIQHYIII